jgi:hypothetical protein
LKRIIEAHRMKGEGPPSTQTLADFQSLAGVVSRSNNFQAANLFCLTFYFLKLSDRLTGESILALMKGRL